MGAGARKKSKPNQTKTKVANLLPPPNVHFCPFYRAVTSRPIGLLATNWVILIQRKMFEPHTSTQAPLLARGHWHCFCRKEKTAVNSAKDTCAVGAAEEGGERSVDLISLPQWRPFPDSSFLRILVSTFSFLSLPPPPTGFLL